MTATRKGTGVRFLAIALVICTGTGAQAQLAPQGCVYIDHLDVMHRIQTRLANNPDTIHFLDDVRVLRAKLNTVSDRAVLEAVQSNALTIKGNTFLRFLQNSRALLQTVSMDDPNSVTRHFDQQVRSNLDTIGSYLVHLRCSAEEIARDEDVAAQTTDQGVDDEDAGQIIREAAQEILNLKNLFLVVGGTVSAHVGLRLWRSFAARQRRRSKRHPTNYATNYQIKSDTQAGGLIDINCYGTKLRHGSDAPLAKGTKVAIQIDDEWINCTVMWSNAHYAGLQFSRSIDLATVGHIRAIHSKPEKRKTAP